MSADCLACTRPTGDDAYLCPGCTAKLRAALAEASSLDDELTTTLTRQDRVGGQRVGGRSSETPLAYNVGASEMREHLATSLRDWVRVASDDRVLTEGPSCSWCSHSTCTYLRRHRLPEPTITEMALWLHGQTEWLRHQQWADEALDGLLAVVRDAQRVVDAPTDRVFAGVCGAQVLVEDGFDGVPSTCPASLYARLGKAVIRCPACGTEHDVQARRDEMRAALEHMLFTAAEIATLATYLGESLGRERVRKLIAKWQERGTVEAHGRRAGQPLYPYGLTVDRIVATVTRHAA